ncbi:MAG: flagellar biosynthesis protein FlhB [Desulfobacterium sp.]
MADDSSEDKDEQATPKKRQDARKKGDVAKSKELPSVAVLLSGLLTFIVFGTYMYAQIQNIMIEAFQLPHIKELSLNDFFDFSWEMVMAFFMIMAPLFLVIFIVAILSNVMQVGFMMNPESIMPKFSKLDPLKGIGRLFSTQSVMEAIKCVAKLLIVGWIGYITIKGEMDQIFILGELAFEDIVSYIFLTTFKLFIRCTMAMIVIVVIDYAFQKWQFEKKLKMSKKEIKDESKESEGDPMVKSRIRNIQMQMAQNRMMQDVPDADVVITNPTHYAVALKYDDLSMGAPRVLAKGKGEIAKNIKALAVEHSILLYENRELARNLYKMVKINQEVPALLYQAVAEVLAYVYRQRQGG